jgi:hypothetical protein
MKKLLALLALPAALAIDACGPPPQVLGSQCAMNPATGHIFGIAGGSDCGHGPGHYYVDLACGPLTIATTEDDVCVRANIVGDGTSTGIRGVVIVPLWYVNVKAGDVVDVVVE